MIYGPCDWNGEGNRIKDGGKWTLVVEEVRNCRGP